MRITSKTVARLSAYAGQLSNGYVRNVVTGAETGSGARIADGNSDNVWVDSPRDAAGYYLGQIDVYAASRGIAAIRLPEDIQAIRTEVIHNENVAPSVMEWYGVGRDFGRDSMVKHFPEIASAGSPCDCPTSHV